MQNIRYIIIYIRGTDKASSGERVDRAAVQIPLFSHPPGEKRCADPPVFCENTSILRDLRVI